MKNPPNPVAVFVRSLRAKNGWSQEALAGQHPDLKRSVIAQWETGRNMPKDETLPILAELAGVDVEYLRMLKQHVEMQRRGFDRPAGDLMLSAEEHHALNLVRSADWMALAEYAIQRARPEHHTPRRITGPTQPSA